MPRSLVTRKDALDVIRYTRNWIHYGVITMAFVITITAAVEQLLGL